jgi:SAM-dependent methyltransferase
MSQPNPPSVFDLAASNYMVSRVLQACARFSVFSQLASSALSVETLADKCRISVRGAQALLTALRALGLAELANDKWRLSPGVAEQLPDEDMLAGLVGGYQDWLTLEEAVRTGNATVEPSFRRDSASLRQFLVNMHFSSQPVARELASQLPVSAPKRILDVGGGVGTYAVAICRRFRPAQAVVFELPEVAAVGERLLARTGLAHRIRFLAGDYLSDPFPTDNDLILMCNILHQERPKSVRLLLKKAAGALVSDGWLLIHETLLEDKRLPSLPVALTALNNLLYYGSKNHHEYQVLKWIKASGLSLREVKGSEQPGVRVILAQRASHAT